MYSGLTSYGKITLPSVESWGTNLNILRDPPKSLMTRKIDRVGQTSAITSAIDASGDRACEAINRYARGVNPMVSVSYGNQNAQIKDGGETHAFLPYRVIRDGAFRPPVRRQEDLLPLSRMPRIWTTVQTQPYSVDFSKRVKSCGANDALKEVKQNMLRANCEAQKIISTQPGINAPKIVGMTRPEEPVKKTQTNLSRPINVAEPSRQTGLLLRGNNLFVQGNTNASRPSQIADNIFAAQPDPTSMRSSHPPAEGSTNMSRPFQIADANAARKDPSSVRRNHPLAKGATNISRPSQIGDRSIGQNVHLNSNHPTTTGWTNVRRHKQVPIVMQFEPKEVRNRAKISLLMDARRPEKSVIFDGPVVNLPACLRTGGLTGQPSIPAVTTKINEQKSLVKIR